MKECPNCKAKNQNDAAFCADCGASLKDVPTQADEWAAAAGDFLNKAKGAASIGAKRAKEAAAVGAQKAKEAAGTGAEKVQKAMEDAEKKREAAKASSAPVSGSSVLVDPTEHIITTIGSSYLQNYLSGGSCGKGIGILTSKRFYYKGQNFAGKGKQLASVTEEGIVSIEDITFTMFTHVRHIGLLIFSVLLLLVSTIGFSMPQNGYMIAYPCWIAAAVSVIMFFITRQTLFQISFPGGSFGFDIRYYPIADIRDFQRQLHLLKDQRKESAAV